MLFGNGGGIGGSLYDGFGRPVLLVVIVSVSVDRAGGGDVAGGCSGVGWLAAACAAGD